MYLEMSDADVIETNDSYRQVAPYTHAHLLDLELYDKTEINGEIFVRHHFGAALDRCMDFSRRSIWSL